MKFAVEFRQEARQALRGKWTIAVIAGVIAGLLGGAGNQGIQLDINLDETGLDTGFKLGEETVLSAREFFASELGAILTGTAIFVTIMAILLAAVYIVISSVIRIGYCRFNLDLLDRDEQPQLSALFSGFQNWKTAAATALLKGLYVFFWTLLLVIPGIIAACNYAMTDYLLAEDPSMTAQEALARSKELMYGNRWRLVCLHFSFFGWWLLSILTFGLGTLWLTPYRQCAEAAFYREISGTGYRTAYRTYQHAENNWL